MAFTLETATKGTVSVREALDEIERVRPSPDDHDKLASLAGVVQALANDRTLIANEIRRNLVDLIDGKSGASYSPQSLLLGRRGSSYALRANIWPIAARRKESQRLTDKVLAYSLPHDHNFSFLTVGYSGGGYFTTIYEYDYTSVIGYPGEQVEMRFLEDTMLPVGKVMLYRSGRDIHTQAPPDDLSISINLLVSGADGFNHAQYMFDYEKSQIIDLLPQSSVTGIASLFRLAVAVGCDDTTSGLLAHISEHHTSAVVRRNASDALSRVQHRNDAA